MRAVQATLVALIGRPAQPLLLAQASWVEGVQVVEAEPADDHALAEELLERSRLCTEELSVELRDLPMKRLVDEFVLAGREVNPRVAGEASHIPHVIPEPRPSIHKGAELFKHSRVPTLSKHHQLVEAIWGLFLRVSTVHHRITYVAASRDPDRDGGSPPM